MVYPMVGIVVRLKIGIGWVCDHSCISVRVSEWPNGENLDRVRWSKGFHSTVIRRDLLSYGADVYFMISISSRTTTFKTF